LGENSKGLLEDLFENTGADRIICACKATGALVLYSELIDRRSSPCAGTGRAGGQLDQADPRQRPGPLRRSWHALSVPQRRPAPGPLPRVPRQNPRIACQSSPKFTGVMSGRLRSRRISRAALQPGAAMMPPPGWVLEPHI